MVENSNKKVVQSIAVRPVNVCPKCHNKIFHVSNPNYCGHCGQELEWPSNPYGLCLPKEDD